MEEKQDAQKSGKGGLTDQDVKRIGAYVGAVLKDDRKKERRNARRRQLETTLRYWCVLLGFVAGLFVGYRLGIHLPYFH